MSDDETNTIVIDSGSGSIKIGYAGEENPEIKDSNLIGKTKENKNFIGRNVIITEEKLNINYPIKRGKVENWDSLEHIWSYHFEKLSILPSEKQLFISNHFLGKESQMKDWCEFIFEKLKFPCFQYDITGNLNIYASGKTTGISLNIGEGLTTTFTNFEGYLMMNGMMRSEISGFDITEHIQKSLSEKGYFFDKETCQTIKEKNVKIFENPEDIEKQPEIEFELPDGKKIKLGNEIYFASEILFQPNLIGSEIEGLSFMVYNSIEKCHMNTRKQLYK